MGQWTNSNIRHTVTDGPCLSVNMSKCTFNPKKKNPYWSKVCHTKREDEVVGGRGAGTDTKKIVLR